MWIRPFNRFEVNLQSLKVLIVGFGSIGKRHARNFSLLGVRDIHVYEPFGTVDESGIQQLHEVPPGRTFDVCLICTPNHLHLDAFKRFAHCARTVFIEKPVSMSASDHEAFLEVDKMNDCKVMVGCNYRFEKAMAMMKKIISENQIGKLLFFKAEFGHYLPAWRPSQDYRQNYAVKKETGGGVLLDRIHELDYLKWLFGELKCHSALIGKVSDLEIQTEDLVMVNFTGKNGLAGSMHLDYLQPRYHCKLKVTGSEGQLEWGFKPSFLKLISKNGDEKSIFPDSETDVNEMYLNQLKYLLELSVTEGSRIENGLDEAFETLALIEQIREKSYA